MYFKWIRNYIIVLTSFFLVLINMRRFLIVLLLFFIIFSMNVISATDLTNDSVAFDSDDSRGISSVNNILASSSDDVICSNDEFNDSLVVHVKDQINDGDGSEDNPFKNLDLACQYANTKNKSTVTINIHEGTYYLGDNLDFNTSNLYINGVYGKVILKNLCPNKNTNSKEAFRLIPNEGNITFSNVFFDASSYTWASYDRGTSGTNYFTPFYGEGKNVTFINCSFSDFINSFNSISKASILNHYKFIGCVFNFNQKTSLLFNSDTSKKFYDDFCPVFEYCILNLNGKSTYEVGYFTLPCDIYMNNCWFGTNNLPRYVTDPTLATRDGHQWATDWSIPVNRYAQFSVSENYLGDNKWEIIGKLTWNGTDDQDGMENFQPMTVTLSAPYGNLSSTTATLINGSFKVNYTSSASIHHIETKLDNEDNQELDFYSVNITVNASDIYYGDNQNVTINFTQPITANITITVSNETESKNYPKEVINKDSIIYTIPGTLKAGTYTIEVKLADKNLYGSNSTELTISKVSNYPFEPNIPDEAKVGDNVTITVALPEGATGTVTVYVNNKPFTKEASTNTEITINGLVAGNNNITVEYSGNDKYEHKTTPTTSIYAEKVSDYSFDVVVPTDSVKVGENVTITIKLPNDVNGNAIVTIGSQDGKIIPVNSNSTDVIVSGLVAGVNTVKVLFSDDKYAEKTVIKNITAEKVPVNITNNTIVIDSPTNSNTPGVSLNLSSDATGSLIVTVKDKNYTQELVNGSATVTITDLASGTYNATVTYTGDGKYDSITKNITLTVNAIKTTIVAPDVSTTYNVAKNLLITLKDANGKALNGKTVIVKVGSISKTLTTDANGQVSVDISSLVPKTYKATITFAGDDKYASSTASVNVKVTKAKSKITAKKATFKAKKKTKKYTITLKAGKKAISKVKVTLKVKGKTYKATTNAKGKATFKITKLTKKGKHNAVIKFKGNNYYKATSKKVKLTIKK